MAPKKLALDRPERVRQVHDRGEGDYYRVNSRAIQQTSTYAPLAGDVHNLLDTIAQELDVSKVICALDPNKEYLPRRKLPEILTVQRVRTIVSLPWFQEYSDKNKLTRDICFGPYPCLKLLAVLIGIGKTRDLPKHMKDGLNDTCLPMDIETSMLKRMFCQRHQKPHSIINMYQRPNVRLEFSRWCYSLAAPYIRCDKGKHSHYVLQHGDVFPMEIGKKMYEQQVPGSHVGGPMNNIPQYGGFSEVYQVKIDGSHYDFGAIGLRHPNGFFALKRLTSHDRENFNLELASLLFSMDNAHSREANMHLIQPLATFEVIDPIARVTTYYLLFDWAQGNLKDFWRNNRHLVGDKRHSLWMSQQLHEICLALQCVHNERQVTLKSTDTSKLAKGPNGRSSTINELYGRHGDIKPDNFLWFHPARPSSDLLALSDFGLGRLHTQVSRSNQDPRNLARTATYIAPEFDLTDGMISRASDIFSLGCVFLEYVTWFLLGPDSVENQFPGQRNERDIYGFDADKFFVIQADGNGAQRPLLKPQVRNWISELQQHPNCSWYLYQLLEVIRDKMLEPDRERRIHILQLIKEMQKLRHTCERNDSFYLKTIRES